MESFGLDRMEIFFLVCALVGGIPLIIRLILQFIGAGDADHDLGGGISDGGIDSGIDSGLDAGLDADLDSVDAVGGVDGVDGDTDLDPSGSLKLLSLHGLTSFLMMFGLVGFAMYHHNNLGVAASLGGGTVAGLLSFWIISQLFRFIYGLQSSGTLRHKDFLGAEGVVYLTIRENEPGSVTLTVNGRQIEVSAASRDGSAIPTGTRVKVVAMHGGAPVVQAITTP